MWCERFDAQGLRICSLLDACPGELSQTPQPNDLKAVHQNVSVACSAGALPQFSPMIRLRWTANIVGQTLQYPLVSELHFDVAPFVPPTDFPPKTVQAHDPSVAVTRDAQPTAGYARAWSLFAGDGQSAVTFALVDGGTASGELGAGRLAAFVPQYRPCVARNASAQTVIVWAEPEEPLSVDSRFDIYLQPFDAAGNPVGPSTKINQFSVGDQFSPAVALDDQSRIVAVWDGPGPSGCPRPVQRVFGRLMQFTPTGVAFVSNEFLVDYDPAAVPPDSTSEPPHPTVAIDPRGTGMCFVAWNTTVNAGAGELRNEVHGQYLRFDTERPAAFGREFRVPRESGSTGFGRETRALGQSGQHTAVFAPDGRVFAAWCRRDPGVATGNDKGVLVTILPEDMPEALARDGCTHACLKGDVNADGTVNGLDVQTFVTGHVAGLHPDCPKEVVYAPTEICRYDCNSDCVFSREDLPAFVCLLLGKPIGCNPYPPSFADGWRDCNGNGLHDADDIAAGRSLDCTANGLPDECEPDCDGNGFADSCDIQQGRASDCNANGRPDACEADCNANGTPDDCDIAAGRSLDCNQNGTPDECDLTWGISFDCNANGKPDECDIATGYSQDENANNVPDECEMSEGGNGASGGQNAPNGAQGGSTQGGGAQGSGTAPEGPPPLNPDQATAEAEFSAWLAQQNFDGLTPAETMWRIREKRLELRLPI